MSINIADNTVMQQVEQWSDAELNATDPVQRSPLMASDALSLAKHLEIIDRVI